MELYVLILSRFLGRNIQKLKSSELIMSEAWGSVGGGVGFQNKNRWNKIVDAYLWGFVFMYVMYVCFERGRGKEEERERDTHTLQILRIKLFSNLCAAHIFYCKKCFRAEPDMWMWVSPCYYASCLRLWYVRLFCNANAWCTTGKILGKYL